MYYSENVNDINRKRRQRYDPVDRKEVYDPEKQKKSYEPEKRKAAYLKEKRDAEVGIIKQHTVRND